MLTGAPDRPTARPPYRPHFADQPPHFADQPDAADPPYSASASFASRFHSCLRSA